MLVAEKKSARRRVARRSRGGRHRALLLNLHDNGDRAELCAAPWPCGRRGVETKKPT